MVGLSLVKTFTKSEGSAGKALLPAEMLGEGFDGGLGAPIYSPRSMADRAGPGRPPDPRDAWGGMSVGVAISAYLLAALAVWGGVGYVIDRLAGTGRAFTAVGMVIGAAAGIYLIYLRYGRQRDDSS